MSRLIEHFADRGSWVGIALTSIVGITGNVGDNEPWEKPSTLRFRALADPTRPLAATDLERPLPSPSPEFDPPQPRE